MKFSLLFASLFVQAVLHKEFVGLGSDKLLGAEDPDQFFGQGAGERASHDAFQSRRNVRLLHGSVILLVFTPGSSRSNPVNPVNPVCFLASWRPRITSR